MIPQVQMHLNRAPSRNKFAQIFEEEQESAWRPPGAIQAEIRKKLEDPPHEKDTPPMDESTKVGQDSQPEGDPESVIDEISIMFENLDCKIGESESHSAEPSQMEKVESRVGKPKVKRNR